MASYDLFETEIGWTGLIWNARGLIGVHLPEPSPEEARAGLRRRFPEAQTAPLPARYGPLAEQIRALLRGGKTHPATDFLDLASVPDFNARVYAIACAIPPGETLTYGEIALQLGDKLLAREVGQALGQNPWPIIVPCHRVTAAGGKLGGFSARGGGQTKLKLLAIEGAAAAAQGDLFG